MKTSLLNLSFIITQDEAGQRLDKFLSTLEEISSRNYAKTLIEKSLVKINGKSTKPSQQLSVGSEVTLSLPPPESTELKAYDFKLDIIFEDDELLVVNKPCGLVVHPAAGHQHDTLVNALLHHTKNLSMKNEQRPGIVHRIDKDTSGLLVVAKNDSAHDFLAQQFKSKTAHRIYYALVSGNLNKISGTCRSYLARHPTDRKKYCSLKKNNRIIAELDETITSGKWAVTNYKKMAQTGNTSYLKLQLETGRTHQIRVHVSELGHPIVGDLLYGFPTKKSKELLLDRFFLHAAELGFIHPTSKAALMFKAPWPKKDLEFLRSLGYEDSLLQI